MWLKQAGAFCIHSWFSVDINFPSDEFAKNFESLVNGAGWYIDQVNMKCSPSSPADVVANWWICNNSVDVTGNVLSVLNPAGRYHVNTSKI